MFENNKSINRSFINKPSSTNKGIFFIWLIIFINLSCLNFVKAQQKFNWEDTPFADSKRPSILQSKYHLFQSINSASFHSTNFYNKNYNGATWMSENRLFVPRLSEMYSSWLPDPYIIYTIKGLKDLDEEKRVDYGYGIEWRPFKAIISDSSNFFVQYLLHTRFYAIQLFTYYLDYQQGWDWRPKDDLRIGIEIYRECNLYNRNFLWNEIWSDLSWRKTNFFINDYNSIGFSIVPKFGIKPFKNYSNLFMPYISAEVSVTERSDFWQNHILVGGGVRCMPFNKLSNNLSDFFKATRIFFEALYNVKYLKDSPITNTPKLDLRVGLNLNINRW